MSFATRHNINAYIGVAPASDSAAATAGGTGDATLVTGLVIDRSAFNSPQSVAFLIRYKAVLAQAATVSYAYSIETAVDSAFTVPVVLQSATSAVVDTGATGGSTQRGVFRIAADLAGALQFIRLKFTPDLSAANTDTLESSAVAVLGGGAYLPA